MFEVKSYLKQKNSFIPISEFNGEISAPDYIEGAIEISSYGKKILTLENWDYVDQLWAYFVDGLLEVSKGTEFKTFLPDQPTRVCLKPDSNLRRVLITVGKNSNNSISVEYKEFMNVMIKEAKSFFEQMNRLLSSRYDYELEQLRSLEKSYTAW